MGISGQMIRLMPLWVCIPLSKNMSQLNLNNIKKAAKEFAVQLSSKPIPGLFGVTDGKAVGTYVEHAFHEHLKTHFSYKVGSSASGIDIPELSVDIKVTSTRQPQSSCPFTSAKQKVYGLGYHLLVFVYEKTDDRSTRAAKLQFVEVVFVDKKRTGDYQTTYGLLGILERKGNKDDVIAFLEERNLPLDDISREKLAEDILKDRPEIGYLTISNALQWRLQYSRVISLAAEKSTDGVENLLG